MGAAHFCPNRNHRHARRRLYSSPHGLYPSPITPPLVPNYASPRRDALIKPALIHVCSGNTTTAEPSLERAERVPRTSSWFETHLAAQRGFVRVLTHSGSNEESLANLWAISLDS